jgi:hypothetical protein
MDDSTYVPQTGVPALDAPNDPSAVGFNGPQGTLYDSAKPTVPPPAGGAPPSIAAPDSVHQMAAAFLGHLLQNQPAPSPDTIAGQKAAADLASKQPTPQPDKPSTGSFRDKLANAVGRVEGALGDAAHAKDTKGGWLSGVVNTLNARNQRLAQQAKDQELHAKNQVETLALNRNIWRQDEEIREKGLAANRSYYDTMRVNHDVHDDINQDDAMKLAKDPAFLSTHQMDITGQKPLLDARGGITKDKNGNPVMIPTFSYMNKETKDGQPDDIKVSADEAANASKLLGQKMPEGTKLTNDQYRKLTNDIKAVSHAKDILEITNGKPFSDDHLKNLTSYLTDSNVQAAISEVPGSAYAGVQKHIANADEHIAMYAKQAQDAKTRGDQTTADAAEAAAAPFVQERNKLTQFTAAAITPKQIDDFSKKSDDATQMLTDLQKKADAAHGEEAAAMAASTQQMLDNGNYTDAQKKVLTRIQSQTTAAAEASQKWEVEKEKKKQETTNALAEGDTDVLVDAALNYQLDPNKLYSMRKNTNAEFKAQMLRKDPTWSEAVYKQRYQMQQELGSDKPNSMGGQIESLNRFAMHTGSANRGIEGLRNISSPIINTPLNKIKAGMVGFEQAQAFKIEAETAKDEYLNFIKNGHVPPTEQEERLAAMISENRTPAELQSTFRAMAELVGARAKAMNGRYNTIMGSGNIPGLIQPDTNSILRQFGVDVDAITNPKGTTSFSRPINGPAKPKLAQVNRPQDLATATGAAPDPKTNKMYWHDASGKVLREVKPNEIPNE